MDRLIAAWQPATHSGGMTEKPRLLTNHFNGDVTFDRPDGINTDLHTYNATWEMPTVGADGLIAFLRAHACRAFLFAAPRDSVERIWEATEWSRSSDYDRDIVQVTFEERFMATTPAPPLPPPPLVVFRFDSSPLGGSILLG